MSKRKGNHKFNGSECFETDKFEMMDDAEIYMDRASMNSRGSKRDTRRSKKEAEHRKRDHYLDEMYGY